MASCLESAIARVIAEGKVRTYDMSGYRGDTDSLWRDQQRIHARRGQSRRRLRQLIDKIDILDNCLRLQASSDCRTEYQGRRK